jgi:IS1 family transposase
MNILSRDKQIEIIAALTEGVGVRATTRLTGVDRKTVARLALRIGRGCAELHDRMVVGVRTGRIELDELWAFVGKKQKRVDRPDHQEFGDQYTYVALSSSTRAILSYHTGKRDAANTDVFIQDLRERVIGAPELSMDGFQAYQGAIRHSFKKSSVGVITKTYHVTNLNKSAAVRYSPAEVVAVSRDVVAGTPEHISTSYVERSHLTLRMSCRRFGRLTNGFSKRIEQHAAAVSLHVSYYNFCRVHESLRTTPAVALGIADRVWSIGDLLDAALATQPIDPVVTAPDRRKHFRVIDGGKED